MEGKVVDTERILIETLFNGIIDETLDIQAKEEKVIIEYAE